MKEHTDILSNGVTIHSFKNTNVHSFAIALCVRGGPLYESADDNGFSHFYEHMVFKNINALMDGKLSRTLDLHGLYFNAATYDDYIEFKICGASRHFTNASQIISLALSPFVLSSEDIRAEIKRIKAEIHEEDDASLARFSDATVYAGSPLARPILGSCRNVDRFGVKKLNQKHPEFISNENIFFYVCGNFSKEDYQGFKTFVEAQSIPYASAKTVPDVIPDGFENRSCVCKVKNASSSSVMISFDVNTDGYSVPEIFYLCDLIFSGESCPMYRELSEKTGLTYSYDDNLSFHGSFAVLNVSYEIRADKLMQSLEAFFTMLANIRRDLGARIPYLRASYEDNIYITADDSESLVSDLCYYNHILRLGYKTLEEHAKAFGNVDSDRINTLSMQVFRPENLVIAIKGNKKRINKEKIRRMAIEKLKAD